MGGERMEMEIEMVIFLVLVTGIGTYYSYIILAMLIAITLMNIAKKKEVKQ